MHWSPSEPLSSGSLVSISQNAVASRWRSSPFHWPSLSSTVLEIATWPGSYPPYPSRTMASSPRPSVARPDDPHRDRMIERREPEESIDGGRRSVLASEQAERRLARRPERLRVPSDPGSGNRSRPGEFPHQGEIGGCRPIEGAQAGEGEPDQDDQRWDDVRSSGGVGHRNRPGSLLHRDREETANGRDRDDEQSKRRSRRVFAVILIDHDPGRLFVPIRMRTTRN